MRGQSRGRGGDSRTIILAGKSSWWGPAVQLTSDLGDTWREPPSGVRFAEGRGHSVERIWMIKPTIRPALRRHAGRAGGGRPRAGDRWETLFSHLPPVYSLEAIAI